MSGMVYLVGAGPGDPGLLTVKGLELMKKADCIIYDRLCSPELLDYARPDCECIYAGKADSHHTMPQEIINELLVEKAKRYKCVVRLKGGDPYVFGRGGEEGIYLREHGISFLVVPGVSSAIAGAAYAGIPVTHRGIATSFRVITAHRRTDSQGKNSEQEVCLDYSSMLNEEETLVFLMGLCRVEQIARGLLQAGRRADTPAAVISHATTPEQRTCVGTLENIAEMVETRGLTSPAMIVVGEVVGIRDFLNSYEKKPLFGKRYLIPKIGQEPSRLAAALREKGAMVTETLVGRITGIPARYTGKELSEVDLLIFTSANGVKYFMRNLFSSGLDVRALSDMKLVVIGEKTAEKLREYGLIADLVPQQFDGKTLAEEIRAVYTDAFHRPFAWYPTAKNAGDDLVDDLLSVCDCGRLNVYENVACQNEEPGDGELMSYDGIFFTCASSAERLFAGRTPEFLARLAAETKIYSIGPKCSSALTAMGAAPLIEAAPHTYEGLLHLIN